MLPPKPPPGQVDSWEAAERAAADWMRYWGYSDARVTASGADAGVDVASRRALAQVKFEAAQVGRPVLQRLVGARGRNHDKQLLCFSGAGFSQHAIEYAADLDIALFKYSLTGHMAPVNSTARQIVADAEAARRAAKPVPPAKSAARTLGGIHVADLTTPTPRPPTRQPTGWGIAAFLAWAATIGIIVELVRGTEQDAGALGGALVVAIPLAGTWLYKRHKAAQVAGDGPPLPPSERAWRGWAVVVGAFGALYSCQMLGGYERARVTAPVTLAIAALLYVRYRAVSRRIAEWEVEPPPPSLPTLDGRPRS